jgi:hypothetical protein
MTMQDMFSTASNWRIILHDELERVVKEAVVVYI